MTETEKCEHKAWGYNSLGDPVCHECGKLLETWNTRPSTRASVSEAAVEIALTAWHKAIIHAPQEDVEARRRRCMRAALSAALASTAETPARRETWEEALECQPSTAENPNESAYQRGRFDGIMEYSRAIRARATEERDDG